MRLNFLIGGKAGQGINKISEIMSNILNKYGYFTFNYREYPSLIRGGHNFNILSVSDKKIGSNDSLFDGIIAMDDKTLEIHKKQARKNAFFINYKGFENLGKNLNIALCGAFVKLIGLPEEYLIEEVKKEFKDDNSVEAAKRGYDSFVQKIALKKLSNKIYNLTGNEGIGIGAINSKINLYLGYPMTPSTGVLSYLASKEKDNGHLVFQPESEIAAINMALGASFAGARVMVGTSGGGFDLMGEGLSFQGISQIPLTIYLSSRPGPGTGIPTYTSQSDLNIALKSGHGEFPRVVAAPGDALEAIEKTNELMYLAEKYGVLSIILGDKHLAESSYSFDKEPKKPIMFEVKRKVPGRSFVKASSYEHDEEGNTSEESEIAIMSAKKRLEKKDFLSSEIKKFESYKIHGNKKSKNLIVGFGSTKGAILDAIKGLDYKFLQIIYLEPFPDEIRNHLIKAEKIIAVENNLTGQLCSLIAEKTSIQISLKNRILRYDGRPFFADELKKEIVKK